jgi:hypothetical protein
MGYRYKADSTLNAYNSSESVIHFKFGDMRKMYFFTEELQAQHPNFCKEYIKYWNYEPTLLSDPLAIVNYIEAFNIPVKLYSNFVDEEFADFDAAREWICAEYGGQSRDKLYKYENSGYVGLDGERSSDET